MDYFYGIVEDRQDPLKVGRVRVRIHGIHTDDKLLIASADLPWCQVILPTTSAGLSGLGTGHGLVEGSTVFGYFRDQAKQDPIILGVAAGIPQAGYKEDITDALLTRSIEKGFNDPRALTVDGYKDGPEAPNPTQDSRRGWGLTTAMDTAPKSPETIDVKYDNTGSTIKELELTEEMLPYYPLYVDESDYSTLARGSVLDHKIAKQTDAEGNEVEIPDEQKILKDFVDVDSAPVYPYNKVTQSESGHVFEVDDTLGKERINVHHRSGTFHEIHADGSEVTRIVNNNYTAILKDDKVFIAGNTDLQVGYGNVNITIDTGNVDLKVLKGNVTELVAEGNVDSTVSKGNVTSTITEGNFTGQIGGTTDVTSEGKITITGNNTTEIISDTTITGTLDVTKATKLHSTLNVTGKQTNSSSITASGEVTGKGVKLSTHTHSVGGSAAPKTGAPS